MLLPKKRISRGRTKGSKGKSGRVQCTNCGQSVPVDKAKKHTARVSLVEPMLARELRSAGSYIATSKTIKSQPIIIAKLIGLKKKVLFFTRYDHSGHGSFKGPVPVVSLISCGKIVKFC